MNKTKRTTKHKLVFHGLQKFPCKSLIEEPRKKKQFESFARLTDPVLAYFLIFL